LKLSDATHEAVGMFKAKFLQDETSHKDFDVVCRKHFLEGKLAGIELMEALMESVKNGGIKAGLEIVNQESREGK
jgi:hypothetical protein